jgi:hypothetical protein
MERIRQNPARAGPDPLKISARGLRKMFDATYAAGEAAARDEMRKNSLHHVDQCAADMQGLARKLFGRKAPR